MKRARILDLASICFSVIAYSASVAEGAAPKPNIVVILADDLGYADIGCYGREDIQTPHLDRLAAEGTRFTAHYANGPECTPTRVALLTGRYPQWVGGLECAIGTGNVGRYDDAVRLRESNDLGLPPAYATLPRLLKEAGYATAITGKWHLGYEAKFAPHLHGFDKTFYCVGGGMDYFHYLDTVAGYNLFSDGRPIRREGYFTDLATKEAVDFIETNKSKPFFLYLPYTAPHTPYQGPDDHTPDPIPLDSPLWKQGTSPPKVYIAMIEHMDTCIGRLLEALDRHGLEEETLVIFASDNGGTRSARNAPHRGYKGSTFEGGIRVPAIVRWPSRVPAGKVSDHAIMTFDFTVSIARLAGVAPPADKPFEGLDVVRRLEEGGPDVERTLFWRKPRGDTLWMAVREGALKYVGHREGDVLEEYLFDLSADPSEQEDLSDDRPEDLRRLQRLYKEWESTTRRDRRGRPAE